MLKTSHPAPRALVVDDDVESIQPLQIVLRNFGFEITLAFDGREALDEISKSAFDIVFLDICLPDMTGLEMLQKVESIQDHDLKFNRREHTIPVITYSSQHMGEYDIPDGDKFFFADHWQKPVLLSDLASMTGQTMEKLGITKNLIFRLGGK